MYVVYNELGNIADKFCNDYERAQYYYNLAINLRKDYADVYNNLAILYAKNNNTTEAENCFIKELGIEPKHKYLLENYTTFLQLADRNVEDITYLKNVGWDRQSQYRSYACFMWYVFL
ncbi:tetratricopeptide repeat protein [Clostridium beijerinckii]|uniref:Uncharacterized protein n=1 Tax=Clostridium beijerinckii TaxID=1520 RepID=A0A1S9NCG4_CLOBE|nr:tetratricopeptide repeat protein [Clostridium beijerinckii]OOP75168.1 hypothetical protein CBEIBR21_03085 [Clostridium beijerinckii]